MTIAENLAFVLKEIETHVKACNRASDQIKLIAVSKNVSPEKILQAYEYGLADFAESRVLEAIEKKEALPSDIRWHFIGRLQKNKVTKAIGSFTLIHSVDTYELAKKISEGSLEKGMVTPILLQANISGEATKAGFSQEELRRQFADLNKLQGINIQGLMTIAPLTKDENLIRSCFRNLRLLKEELGLERLSMGMSNDYKIAISEGATLLRIGSAIFN